MTGGEIERAKGADGYEPTSFDPLGNAVAPSVDGVDLTEAVKPAVPRMDIIEANDRVKKAGLDKHLTLPDQPDIPPAQLEIMMRNAQARAEREATIERGPQGFIPSALQVGTSFLVGAADPINVASAFIPIMGELRYGKVLAAAGDSLTARLATRAAVGAGQGAVGQAALEPLDWWAHTQEGRDFGMSDVLHNVMFGAALGGGLHAGGGFISDAYRGAKGRELYPFGPNEPLARVPDMGGIHVPAAAMGDEGISADHLEQHFRRIEPGETGQAASGIAESPEMDAIVAQVERGVRADGTPLTQDDRFAAERELRRKSHPEEENFAEDGSLLHALKTVTNVGYNQQEVDRAINWASRNGRQDIVDALEVRERAMEELYARSLPPSPEVAIINDLPPRAHEDAMRVAISDLINGDAVRSGDVLEVAAKTDPRIAESFEAWHGSPHDFERFDLSKIGTGEGAQAYGHGLYFAENEKVAHGYQRSVSDKVFVDKVAQLYDEGYSPGDAWAEIKDHWSEFSPSEQRLMLALEKDDWFGYDYPHQAVNAALRSLKNYDPSPETVAAVKAIGNMYRVKIGANHEHFLDWDKPLHEQSEHVKGALTNLGIDVSKQKSAAELAEEGLLDHTYRERNGQHAYQSLIKYRPGQGGGTTSAGVRLADLDKTPDVASAKLSAAGIPGIKYLDQGSRAGALAPEYRVYQEGEKFYVSDRKPRAAGPFATQAEAEAWVASQATRNFVVFNDKHIEITHKNGEPVKREEFLQQREEELAAAVKAKGARGRAAADPQTWSLFEFLAHEGGLKPDPELAAIFGSAKGPFVPGFGALVRSKGRALDDALRLAKDHGYMFDAADVTGAEGRLTPNDLLDRLAEENSGRKLYRHDQQFATKAEVAADLEREKHEIISALHDEIEAATGQKGVKVDPALQDRVVQIVQREGEHDVLGAYERAIMEDAERYETISHERRQQPETAHVPGWDVDEPAGASRDGQSAAQERGQAGGAAEGTGRADGGQPRGAGPGDRGPVPAQLDQAAAWRGIAHVTPDFDTPEAIAASNAAAKVEPPKTKLDERVTAAEKAEAFAKQMYDMFAHRLPEDERLRLEEHIAELERAQADRDTVSQRGAACLFEGRGS
ncbi:hypothetical protein [Bradyrhizobium sp. RT9a]|uniref:hypothetical protein n=1 Tax=Bradyrhizobium sp. RT9a TaxID=3156384 RepID=UPI0033910D4C